MSGRFATLTFERKVPAPVLTLWQAWSAPAARAVWAAPTPTVPVEFLEADTRAGGREVSLCKVEGEPDIRCEVGWLELQTALRSVNYEVISSEGVTQSAALVTADFTESGDDSHVVVTVQLSSLAEDMETGYRQGFGSGLDNLAGAAERTMILQRVIKAPRNVVWEAWMNAQTLPRWWGPDGFSCDTKRIDLCGTGRGLQGLWCTWLASAPRRSPMHPSGFTAIRLSWPAKRQRRRRQPFIKRGITLQPGEHLVEFGLVAPGAVQPVQIAAKARRVRRARLHAAMEIVGRPVDAPGDAAAGVG